MAHFLQHTRSPPGRPIFPKCGQFRASISYQKGHFPETNGLARIPPKFRKILGNLTFLTRLHFEPYRRTKMAHFRNVSGLPVKTRFSQNSANFEPRLDIKRGHFSRLMDWPIPLPQKFWKIVGNLTILTRPHFEQYPRTEMAQCRQHSRSHREGVISPKFGQF